MKAFLAAVLCMSLIAAAAGYTLLNTDRSSRTVFSSPSVRFL